VQEIRLRKTIT